MTSLGRFLALPAGERRLLVTSALWVAALRLGLWVLPLRSVLRLLARWMPEGTADRVVHGRSPERIAWAVRMAGRYVPGAGNCLVQALAAHRLLARRGHRTLLCIGVAKNETGGVSSHAWVEYQGAVVIGGRVAEFTPLAYLARDRWQGPRDLYLSIGATDSKRSQNGIGRGRNP